jgi:hypothetical protein
VADHPAGGISFLSSGSRGQHHDHVLVSITRRIGPVQIGNLPRPRVQFDKLIVVELLPVCSAEYLQRLSVGAIEDLFEHVLLCSV